MIYFIPAAFACLGLIASLGCHLMGWFQVAPPGGKMRSCFTSGSIRAAMWGACSPPPARNADYPADISQCMVSNWLTAPLTDA